MKVYIIHAKENWIIDRLVEEWEENNIELVTDNMYQADVIWLLSHSKIFDIPLNYTGKIITTIHHLVPWKIDKNSQKLLRIIDQRTHFLHAISPETQKQVKYYFTKPCIYLPFWNDTAKWSFLDQKKELRDRFQFNSQDFLIGSFQRDTEYLSILNKTFRPKLEKGPDILVQSLDLLRKYKYPNLRVILTGERREYVIYELEKRGIPFHYFEMINQDLLNQLYNCLDLYLVTSRVEGGPRAINECGLTKTPLISTQVGISSLICHPKSIFEMDKVETILKCEVHPEYNYQRALLFSIESHMNVFTDILFKKYLF